MLFCHGAIDQQRNPLENAKLMFGRCFTKLDDEVANMLFEQSEQLAAAAASAIGQRTDIMLPCRTRSVHPRN